MLEIVPALAHLNKNGSSEMLYNLSDSSFPRDLSGMIIYSYTTNTRSPTELAKKSQIWWPSFYVFGYFYICIWKENYACALLCFSPLIIDTALNLKKAK